METLCQTSLVSNSSCFMHHGKSIWSEEENKKFENALAMFDEKSPNRWLKVAAMIPGKSVYDVINQYRELVADVNDIEAGLVPVPGYYLSSSFHRGFDVCRKRGRNCDHERKKGVPWTEDEHRRFLLGLAKHGKGDWKNISRDYVVSKTPTQVASHAQKYFLRQVSGGKDRRRPSIHDITFHLPDTCQLDIKRPRLCNEVKSVQAPRILVGWNHHNNGGPLMVFDSAFSDSSYIGGTGAYSPGSEIESPKFRY